MIFRAMVQKDATRKPIGASVWKPYVKGEIDVYDINCVHDDMYHQEHLAKISGLLAQRLDRIHTLNMK